MKDFSSRVYGSRKLDAMIQRISCPERFHFQLHRTMKKGDEMVRRPGRQVLNKLCVPSLWVECVERLPVRSRNVAPPQIIQVNAWSSSSAASQPEPNESDERSDSNTDKMVNWSGLKRPAPVKLTEAFPMPHELERRKRD